MLVDTWSVCADHCNKLSTIHVKKMFVNLKSNLAILSNKGHNLFKVVLPSSNVQ